METDAPVPFFVHGKTAIVTGAGSGINYSFTKLLLSKNCNVVLADLALRPEAQELVAKYTSAPRAVFHKTNVTSWTDLTALFAFAATEFGTFHIVCPGAGVYEPLSSNFWHPPTGDPATSFSQDPTQGHGHYLTLDINITHPIRATQLALAEFLKPSDGSVAAGPRTPKRVLHIASIAAQGQSLVTPMYVASKHCIDGFVRSMGMLEASLGVRVNAVAPGLVRTPLWLENEEKLQMVSEEEDEWVTPEEVAESMLRLLEDPELGGGTVLEVGRAQTRVVPLFGNPGPSGRGMRSSNAEKGRDDVFKALAADGWGKLKGQEHG